MESEGLESLIHLSEASLVRQGIFTRRARLFPSMDRAVVEWADRTTSEAERYRTVNDAFQRHYLAVAPDTFHLGGDIVGR